LGKITGTYPRPWVIKAMEKIEKKNHSLLGKALALTEGRLLHYRAVPFVEAEVVTDLEIRLNSPAISKR